MFFNVCSPLPCDQGGFTEYYIGNMKKNYFTPDNKKKGKKYWNCLEKFTHFRFFS